MRDVRIEFEGVWKKFRRGERAGSLRDLIPAMARRMLTGGCSDEIREGEFYSLRDVHLQVRAGECLGIIGPNGAGKSTMLKLASRILRPNRGKVAVHGRVSALIEVGAGFHHDLTGRENVVLNGLILGMGRKEIADRFDQIVDFAGMADFIDTPVKRYSSGMYARLGFAVASFMDPDVLLIDEALSVGDQAFAMKCEQRIHEILTGETTVVFVSHQLSAVRMICDRVLVMNSGRAQFDGPPDLAIQAYHELLRSSRNAGQTHPSIRRLQLELADGRGSTASHCSAGETIRVEIDLTAAESIREASVGFFVRDSQDVEVYRCVMERLGGGVVDLAAGESFRAAFQFTANLLPGAYGIGTMVHGRTASEGLHGRVAIDRTPNRAELIVSGSTDAEGSANLFATVQVDRRSSRTAVYEGAGRD